MAKDKVRIMLQIKKLEKDAQTQTDQEPTKLSCETKNKDEATKLYGKN